MPTNNLQEDSVSFQDIIERYRRDPKHGEQWVERLAFKLIEDVSQAVERKDYGYLLSVTYPENPFMREIFTRITGLQLRKTQRESRKVLEAFVGPENVAVYQQQREQERARRAFDRLQRQVGVHRVQADGYGTPTVDRLIERLITDGFTTVSEQKRGAATEWFLKNAQGLGYTFRRRIERDYIEALLKRLQGAKGD